MRASSSRKSAFPRPKQVARRTLSSSQRSEETRKWISQHNHLLIPGVLQAEVVALAVPEAEIPRGEGEDVPQQTKHLRELRASLNLGQR